MTTAASGAGRDRRRDWLDHRAPALMIVEYVLVVPALLTSGWISLVLIGTAVYLQFWSVFLTRRHNHRLCAECIDNWPLDPEAEVAHRMNWLRIEHRFNLSPKQIAITGLGIMGVLIASLWLPRGAITAVVIVTNLVVLPAGTRAAWVHSRLQPWCPWCRESGGGEAYFDPDPAPDPSKTKVGPVTTVKL